MKRYLIPFIVLSGAGCDCDCGKIAVMDHYETPRGMQLYFVIDTPCGEQNDDVDIPTFAAHKIGDRYCVN